METSKNYFFRDMGVALGRSMRPVLRSRDTMIAVTIILMPIAFMLLLVYLIDRVIQTLEEIFLAIISNKKEN